VDNPSFVVRLAILDVGQGDTMVVSIPETGEAVVVDCVDPEMVFAYLQNERIRYVRGLIITHLHLDHYRGAIRFLENCDTTLNLACEKMVFNWPHESNARRLLQLLEDADLHSSSGNPHVNAKVRLTTYERLVAWADHIDHHGHCEGLTAHNRNEPLFTGNMGQVIEILQPRYAQIGALTEYGLNNVSGVLRVTGAGTSALLTGDVEPIGWAALRSINADLILQRYLSPAAVPLIWK